MEDDRLMTLKNYSRASDIHFLVPASDKATFLSDPDKTSEHIKPETLTENFHL